MNSRALFSVLFLASVLAACGGAHRSALPVSQPLADRRSPALSSFISDSEIDLQMDSQLSPADRQIMHDVMLRLPRDERANVAFFSADGKNYSNRVWLRAAMRRAHEIRPNLFQSDDGKVVPGPPRDPLGPGISTQNYPIPGPTAGAGTGAFRRIVSPPGNADVQSDVTVPCDTSHYTDLNNDHGYEMLGGWSAGTTAARQAVDAGLEHVLPGQYGATVEDFAVFLLYEAHTAQFGRYLYYTDPVTLREYYRTGDPAHMKCGQSITVRFHTGPDGYLNLIVDGLVVYDGSLQEETIVYQVPTSYDPAAAQDWPESGGGSAGVIVKRFTGLAQTTANLSDGSTEGITPSNTPAMFWNNTYLSQSDNVPWNNWNDTNFPGTRYDTVPCSNIVKYAPFQSYSKAFAEYDGIILNGGC